MADPRGLVVARIRPLEPQLYRMQNLHRVYGLRVASNARLPGVSEHPRDSEADVVLRIGEWPDWVDARGSGDRELWQGSDSAQAETRVGLRIWLLRNGDYFYLQYADGTQFLVDRGATRVWGTWAPSSSFEDAVSYLLGPVLGLVLRLRRITILHASVVAVGGGAVAFVGPAGIGKSTLAAAFALRGYPVLSDDQAVLTECGERSFVHPGYPRIRLWPSSVRLLFGTEEALPRLTPTWTKRFLGLGTQESPFEADALPLAAVYLLAGRVRAVAAPQVSSEPPARALLVLLANLYHGHLMDAELRTLDFQRLGRLARSVPMRRVIAPADPAALPGLCDRIAADLQGLFPALMNGDVL